MSANGARHVKTSAGSWCNFCPAFTGCPQQTALAIQLGSTPELVELEMQRPRTPELASLAWERLDTIEAFLKRVRGSLYALAGASPFTLRNGMVVGPHLKSRKPKIAAEPAYQLAKETWGDEHAMLVIKKVVTKKNVQAAARSYAKANGLKIKDENEGMLERLREGGLLDEGKTLVVEPHEVHDVAEELAALESYTKGNEDGTLQRQLEATLEQGKAPGAGEADDDPF